MSLVANVKDRIEQRHNSDVNPSRTAVTSSSEVGSLSSTPRLNWVSLSALVDERSRGRMMTDLDEDDDPISDTPLGRRNSQSVEDISHELKKKLYLLMEEPSSSSGAFWTNVFVSVLIVFSAIMTTVETIPAFRSAESNRVWFNVEFVMVAIFTLEYILRVFAHSDSFQMLTKFILSPLSIIDFISIVPYYVELLAKQDTTYEFRFVILRLFRLLRLFKTYKYTNTIVMTIEVMVIAFRRSRDALYALFFFLVTCVVLFSTLLYFAERGVWQEDIQAFVDSDGNPSAFDSVPSTFWFIMATITTTGYGNMVPVTFIGKLVTLPAMAFGILLIALPSIILGRHFTAVWEAMKRRQHYSNFGQAQEYISLQQIQQTERHQEEDRGNEEHQEDQNDESYDNNIQTSSNSYIDPVNQAILKELQTIMSMELQNFEDTQRILKQLETK